MPAKENILLLTDSSNQTKLIRKDVDNLVQNIKENLKLTQYETSVQCPSVLASSSLTDFPSSLPDYPSVSSNPHIQNSFKARSYIGSRGSRVSPYGVVPSKNTKFECECIESGGGNSNVKRTSWAARKIYPSMSANGKQKQHLDDPLEMLHELIR